VPDADARPETDAVKPLDVDGVGAVLYGTIAWTLALVACLVLRGRLATDGRSWWTWVCLAGALLGVAGLWFVRRRRAAYAAATSS
jgi:MYXO-CTERM domain-containing protein